MSRRVLMLSSVAYMINQFNLPNIKLLRDMGYEVDVACNLNDDSLPIETRNQFMEKLDNLGVKFYQIDFSRNPFVINKTTKAYRQVRKIMKERNYYFVHCHTPVGGLIGRLAFRKSDTKVIYTAHGFHFYKGAPLINWMIYYPIEKYLSKYTDVLITINDEDYRVSKNKFKSKKNIKLNGVGVNTKKYISLEQEYKKKLKEDKGFNSDDRVLLMIGELNSNKNHFPVLESIASIKKSVPNVKLIIAGQGDRFREYQDYINTNGLNDDINLLGYRGDIPELLQLSDILISTSLREGLPVNVIEALSSSVPVIVSNCRGNVDLVENEYNGFILEKIEPESLSNCVTRILRDHDLYNRLSINAKTSSNKYEISIITSKLKEIYSKV